MYINNQYWASLRRWDDMCTYHSILFACLPELVKMSAGRGERRGRKSTLDIKETLLNSYTYKYYFSKWDYFGCWRLICCWNWGTVFNKTYFSLVFHLLHDCQPPATAPSTAAKTNCGKLFGCVSKYFSSLQTKGWLYNLILMEKDWKWRPY